jgi:hypothetical protein
MERGDRLWEITDQDRFEAALERNYRRMDTNPISLSTEEWLRMDHMEDIDPMYSRDHVEVHPPVRGDVEDYSERSIDLDEYLGDLRQLRRIVAVNTRKKQLVENRFALLFDHMVTSDEDRLISAYILYYQYNNVRRIRRSVRKWTDLKQRFDNVNIPWALEAAARSAPLPLEETYILIDIFQMCCF